MPHIYRITKSPELGDIVDSLDVRVVKIID